MSVITGMKSGLVLLDDLELFGRIADRIAREHDMDRDRAWRTLDQAVVFVAVAGKNADMGLCPSAEVDKGWDTFVLYTHQYHAFCERVAGRYVHHVPNDDPARPGMDPSRIYSPGETADVIRAAGYWVDDELWLTPGATKVNCTSCYSGTHGGKPPSSA